MRKVLRWTEDIRTNDGQAAEGEAQVELRDYIRGVLREGAVLTCVIDAVYQPPPLLSPTGTPRGSAHTR